MIKKGVFYQTDEPFFVFSTVIRDVVDKHPPLKQKVILGYKTPFMNSEHPPLNQKVILGYKTPKQ